MKTITIPNNTPNLTFKVNINDGFQLLIGLSWRPNLNAWIMDLNYNTGEFVYNGLRLVLNDNLLKFCTYAGFGIQISGISEPFIYNCFEDKLCQFTVLEATDL